jgi:hypothetical protein
MFTIRYPAFNCLVAELKAHLCLLAFFAMMLGIVCAARI